MVSLFLLDDDRPPVVAIFLFLLWNKLFMALKASGITYHNQPALGRTIDHNQCSTRSSISLLANDCAKGNNNYLFRCIIYT